MTEEDDFNLDIALDLNPLNQLNEDLERQRQLRRRRRRRRL